VKYLKYILILFAMLILGYAAFVAYSQFNPKVIIRPHAEYRETTYLILNKDGQGISVTTHQTDLNKHILRLRSNLNLPLNNQINLLNKILRKVFKNEDKSQFKTLSVGRLINAFGENSDMSERLKTAAKNSSKWNIEKGRPVAGHENNFVRDIANEAMIYPELKKMFKEFGLEIKFSSAEKVLINPFDNLPFDCLTWFSLKN